MSSSSASAISGLSYSITKTITTNVERTCRWTRMLHSHVQFNGSPCRPRGRHGARSTWTIRDRSDAIDRRHVTAQESARRSGASSIIPPPSGRIGAALSRLIVAGRRACMWSAMAAPGRGAGKAIHWLQEPVRRAVSLSETQTRTYRWCSPPRIGKLSTRPALRMSRGIGASLFNAKCGRTSL